MRTFTTEEIAKATGGVASGQAACSSPSKANGSTVTSSSILPWKRALPPSSATKM